MQTKLLRSAAMIAFFSLFSKFLGFVREMMTAYSFGIGPEKDAYIAARTATIIIMGTIGAALNSSMMPVLANVGDRYGARGKRTFFNRMINLVLLSSTLIVLVSMLFAPGLIQLIAGQFDPSRFQLAVKLTRLGMPLVIFLGMNYLFTSYLHSSEVFAPSAASGIPYNITFFIFLGVMGTSASIEGLMITTVIATLFQFLIMVPSAYKLGYRYRPTVRLYDRYVGEVAKMIPPILIGSSVQQLNTVIDRTLGSGLPTGSISALDYSSRVSDMVISVFIAAITTVIFPMLAEAFVKHDEKQLIRLLKKGCNIILMITIPATVGLLTLSKPLVALFFERGAFDRSSTDLTAGALFFYSIGLSGIAVRLLLNKVFYSLQDTKTPMINGIATVVVNIGFNLILIRFMKINGLALATSIASTFSAMSLFFLLRKKLGKFHFSSNLRSIAMYLIASLLMFLEIYFIYYKLGANASTPKTQQLFLLLSVALAVPVYFVSCLLMGVPELKTVLESIFRKRKKDSV